MNEGDPFEYPITGAIDLHQFAPRDMQAALEAWLEAALERGFRQVRIVHGKGVGFQKEMVRRVLQSSPAVLEFHDAPASAGGWGATIATLR